MSRTIIQFFKIILKFCIFVNFCRYSFIDALNNMLCSTIIRPKIIFWSVGTNSHSKNQFYEKKLGWSVVTMIRHCYWSPTRVSYGRRLTILRIPMWNMKNFHKIDSLSLLEDTEEGENACKRRLKILKRKYLISCPNLFRRIVCQLSSLDAIFSDHPLILASTFK